MVERITTNAFTSRSELLSSVLGNGVRDIDRECFYPTTSQLSAQFYRDLYDREPIANRVCQLMPKETWQGQFEIVEDEDSENETDFEKDVDDLDKSLSPSGKSWHRGGQGQGSTLQAHMMRGDVLCGIGQFAVMLLGLDDGRNLQDPADGVEAMVNNRLTNVYARMPDSPIGESEAALREKDEAAGHVEPWVNRAAKHNDLTCNYAPKTDQRNVRGFNGPASQGDNSGGQFGGGMQGRGGTPGSSPFIQGTDQQYQYTSGIGQPPSSQADRGVGSYAPSQLGTDQQYFGVQFGPSEQFRDEVAKQRRKLLFLREFDESMVQIVRWEWNIMNPRFGMPVMYRVTLSDPRQPHSGVGLPLATVYVHWSRIVHFADNLHCSMVLGVPRMLPVLNPLLDIRKIRAACGEGVWKSAFNLLSFETHPQLGGDVLVDTASLTKQVQDVYNSMQRHLLTSGMAVNSIAPTVTDPTPHIKVNLEAVAIKIGCPMRVFMGAERGELASGQDDEAWNERKREHQQNHCTPEIVVPLIDRLIQLGVVREPEEWYVRWPDMDLLGQAEKAAVALQKTQALGAYVAGNLSTVMAPADYLTRVMEFTDDEAQEIIDGAEKHQEETLDDHGDKAEAADEHDLQPTPPAGFEAKPPPPPKVVSPLQAVNPGQKMVHPETGATVAQGNPMPKPPASKPAAGK